MPLPADKKVKLLADVIVAKAPHKKGEVLTISPVDFARLNNMGKVEFIEDVLAAKPKTAGAQGEPSKKGK